MNRNKALQLAVECMEKQAKALHLQNLSGFHPKATEKELEVLEALEIVKKLMEKKNGNR